jgi:hypothetical protein
VQLTGADVHRHRAAADALFDDQARDEPFFVHAQRLPAGWLHQLLPEHVQDRLAGDRAHEERARLAHAAEAPHRHAPVFLAAEHDAPVLRLEHLGAAFFREHLDGVLVAEVIGGFGRLVRVLFPRPAVFADARSVDAALRCVRVRAHGVRLRDHCDIGTRRLPRDRGAHAR